MDTREVIRCKHCKCNQFNTSNGKCRRCHQYFVEPTIEPTVEPKAIYEQREPLVTLAQQIGTAIQVIRLGLGMTQPELCKITGMPRTYVSKIENAKILPQIYQLERFAYAFGISKSSLLTIAEAIR
jgi:ribosome-binding protein aMBF1 (putative translation factor)